MVQRLHCAKRGETGTGGEDGVESEQFEGTGVADANVELLRELEQGRR